MFIVSIDNDTLTLKITIYLASSCEKTVKYKKSKELDIVLNKSILKGILLRV